MAGRWAGGAAGEAGDHRVYGPQYALGGQLPAPRLCKTIERTWLDRGPYCRDRVSLGGGTQRAPGRDRGRVCPAKGGRHCYGGNPAHRSSKAGDVNYPDRVRRRGGSGRHLSLQQTESADKRLELLREVIPGLRHLAIMANGGNPSAVLDMREAEAIAHTIGLEVVTSVIRRPEDIVPAFEAFKDRVEALYVCNDPLAATNRVLINTSALDARLPTMFSGAGIHRSRRIDLL